MGFLFELFLQKLFSSQSKYPQGVIEVVTWAKICTLEPGSPQKSGWKGPNRQSPLVPNQDLSGELGRRVGPFRKYHQVS